MDAVYSHGVIAYKKPSEGGSTLDGIRQELKPKEIKIESPCTEIMQRLFPYLCTPSLKGIPKIQP